MSASKVDTIFVRFKGDSSDYDKTVDGVNSRLDGMAKRAKKFGKQMSLYVTAPLVAFAGTAIYEFGRVDDAMTKSLAIMGSSLDEFGGSAELMKQEMMDLAVTESLNTSASTKDLADSFFFLASAGFTAKESMEALDDVNRFASAGAFDMATATDLLTDAQSALGLGSKDLTERMENMNRVSDVLVRANTLANATVQQFATSLTSKAGTSMKTFNRTVEEGTAVLAVYADQGIKAELAGSAYDRVLRLLAKSSRTNAEAHAAFGLNVFDAEENMSSMVDIVRELEEGFADLTPEMQMAQLDALGFDARVQQAIFPLIGASDQIAEYQKKLENAGGFTSQVAAKQFMSFGNQMKNTAHHVRALAREVGEILAPCVLRMNKAMASGIKFLMGLGETTKFVLVQMGMLLAIIGPISVGIGTAVPIVQMLATSYATLALSTKSATVAVSNFGRALLTALLPVVAPIALIVAKVAILGAAIAGLWAYMSGAGSISEAWVMIKEAVESVASTVMGFFENWQLNWPIFAGMVKSFVENLGENVVAIFKNMIHNVIAFAKLASEVLGILIGWFIAQGLPMAVEFGKGLVEGIKRIYSWLVKSMTEVIITLMGLFKELANAIGEVFVGVFKEISSLVVKGVAKFERLAKALKDLDFARAAQIGLTLAIDAGVAVSRSAELAVKAGKEALEKLTKPLTEKFNDGLEEGMSTDDLFGSLKSAWDNAGFVDPLANTTIADAPDFWTGRDVDELPMSMDPFTENLLANGWVVPVDLEVN